jgi:hypothetical protein
MPFLTSVGPAACYRASPILSSFALATAPTEVPPAPRHRTTHELCESCDGWHLRILNAFK